MKRQAAKAINEDNKKINEHIRASKAEIDGTSSRLLNNDNLTLRDMNQLGRILAGQQGYDKNQLIVCDVTELSRYLMSHKNDNIEQNPIFIICDNEKNNVAAFCITKFLDKTICLYKDCLNTKIPENIKNILEQQFDKNIELRVNSKVETVNKKDYNSLSLKTLEIMMVHLKSDNKNDFIENFTNQEKTFFECLKKGTVSVKNELFSLVSDTYYKTIASDIEQLSQDQEFKKAIKKFIDDIPLDDLQYFNSYQKCLEKIAAKYDYQGDDEVSLEDSQELENLFKELEFRKKGFDPLLAKYNTNITENKESHQLEIQQQFSQQMEKFTKVFALLAKAEVNEGLDQTLKQYSEKLGLEYETLKRFFKEQETNKDSDIVNSKVQTEGVQEIIKRLAELKTIASDVEVKTLKHLLCEIAIGLDKETSDKLNEDNIDLSKLSKDELEKYYQEKCNNNYTKALEENYQQIKKFYQEFKNREKAKIKQLSSDKKIDLTQVEINELIITEIKDWVGSKKGKLKTEEINEAIAVMDRVNELVTGGHCLRDTQILSILTFLQETDKGKLCQIGTGEGKTTIVAFLAVIKVLKGEVVDIITSNPVLAEDAVRDKKNFYTLLGIKATTNNFDENYKHGPKECYKSDIDIVYGAIGNFQFDYLKDSFLGHKTRAGRPFESIILDEVDSMIIDNASHIAKLSGPLPGMEMLKYIYIKIWQELDNAIDKLVKDFETEIKGLNYDNNETYKQIGDVRNKLTGSIFDTIINHIKSSNPIIDIIPEHIKKYAKNTLDKWIDSAIYAKYDYKEDEQYIIKNNKAGEEVIQPVDNLNTGIILKNTVWQHGLHQFIQLKHNLHLTSESLTSCFISNLSYIKKYNSTFGLTGTLGSEAEQKLLSEVYKVSCTEIPAYKNKQFKELKGEVVLDNNLIKYVSKDALEKIASGRACLIICDTIKTAKNIQELLKNNNPNISIKIYFDEENSKITQEEIKPGDIVIATNIAGRGTDFQTTKELDQNGGLHVCITFLPCNQRVEDQAFGRTARQGKKGTGQLIITESEIKKLGINPEQLENDGYNFKNIKEERDKKEQVRIKEFQDKKIQEITFQDKLFEHFSVLYTELSKVHQNESHYQYVLKDLKEFWAFWLEEQNFREIDFASITVEEKFNSFKLEAQAIIGGEITFNPYYAIQQAENFISHGKMCEAEEALNNAIKINSNQPGILFSAYTKLFDIAIEKGDVFSDKCHKALGELFFIKVNEDKQYKENAKKYLEKAKECINKEQKYITELLQNGEFQKIIIPTTCQQVDIPQLINDSGNILVPDKSEQAENLFIKHIISRQSSLNLLYRLTENLIKQVDTHKGGIAVNSRITDYFSNLKPNNDDEKKIKDKVINDELLELAHIGANITYSLKEVHDVPEETVKLAQAQIGGGIALLASGLAFPPALPVTGQIGGTLITEGICDIAIALISQGDGRFNKSAVIKGKVISYGVSLCTMGISAALECPKILNSAKNACKWISDTLRKCPFLKGVCEKLAGAFDKLGNWFTKMETMAKFNNLNKIKQLEYLKELEKINDLDTLKIIDGVKLLKEYTKLQEAGKLVDLTHLQKFTNNVVDIGKNTTKAIIENVITSKLDDVVFSSILSGIKPKVTRHVADAISEKLDHKKLASNTFEDIEKIIKEIQESPDWKNLLTSIAKYLPCAIAKNSNYWQIQLVGLVTGNILLYQDIHSYTKDLCIKIDTKLSNGNANNSNKEIENIKNKLIEQISEQLYDKIVKAITATVKDVASVGMSIYDNSQKDTVETFIDLDKLPSIVNSEVVTKVVKPILSSFNTESWVKEYVANSISTKLKNVLISNTLEDIEKAITEIQESPNWQNLITSIIKNLPCAIAKNSNHWPIQLAGQGIDIITSCIKVSFYMNNLCEAINIKFNSKLSNGKANNTTSDIQSVRNKLTEQISKQLYDEIISTTETIGKDLTTLSVSAYKNSQKDEIETFIDLDKLPDIINDTVNEVVLPIFSSRIKEKIKSYVSNSISNNLTGIIASNTLEDIKGSIEKIQESKSWGIVVGEAMKGIMDEIPEDNSHWIIEFIVQVVDTAILADTIRTYVNNLCQEINTELYTGKAKNEVSDIEDIKNKLIEQISEQLYDKIVSTTTDKLKDFTAIGTSTDDGSHQDNSEQNNEEIEEIIESPITVQGNKLTKITKKGILGLGGVFNKIKIIKTDIKYIHNEHIIGSDDDITTLGTSISDQA